MTTYERQTLRLKILKKFCEMLDYDINKELDIDTDYENYFKNIFQESYSDEIVKQISYLGEKGYLKVLYVQFGKIIPSTISLNTNSIDLIERIDTNNDIQQYKNDFSENSIESYIGSISNSQVNINLKININNNDLNKLLLFFNKLKEENKNDKKILDYFDKVITEIKNGNSSKNYFKAIGQYLLSFGISISANLLTPEIAKILGIPLS